MWRRLAVLTLALAGCAGPDKLVAADADAGVPCVPGRVALVHPLRLGRCVYLTPSVPDAKGAMVVTLDGRALPYDPAGTRGWSWGAREEGEVRLAGAACLRVASEARPTLAAQVSCAPPEVVVP